MDANTFVILYGSAATGQAGPPPPVFDPTYQLILDAMTANGIPQPTEPQKQKQNALVVDLKAALGDWDRIKSLRVFAGTNQQAALLDWKRYFVMSAVNGPVHSEALGFKGDGVSARIDTGFFANGTDNSFGRVTLVTIAGANYYYGSTNSTSNTRNMMLVQTGNLRWAMHSSSLGVAVGAQPAAPYVSGGYRTATSGVRLFIDATGATQSQNFVSAANDAQDTLFCAHTAPNIYSNFSSGAIGMDVITDTITDPEYQALRAAIQTYLAP
jgi:hypothetical protein